jgi:major type 1 subunit fimbrin (pilin)
MKNIYASVGILACCLSFMGSANAAGSANGAIQFKGTISSESCSLQSSVGDANTVVVPMGTINYAQIGEVGAPIFTTGADLSQADFNIVCKNEAKVSITLAASPAEVNATSQIMRVNNGVTNEGYAQNVGIALYPSSSSSTAYNLSSAKLVDNASVVAGGQVNVKFSAAYVKDGAGEPVAGQANATLPFLMEIQ